MTDEAMAADLDVDLAADLLADLDDDQVHAVTTETSPLCILAGAGSGKTRVLTRRIAWRCARDTADPRHVLALTFTRKAAGELRQRLGRLGVRDQVGAGTFHAVAWAQLRQHWADRGELEPTLLDRKGSVLGPLLRGGGGSVLLPEVAGEIEWAKARLVGPGDYRRAAEAAGRAPKVEPGRLVEIYRRYEEEKRRRHLVDFDDLLIRCAKAIEQDRTFGDAQRWRFRHLFVDEFQDVNPLQHRLLEAWRAGRDDLCVVGDPDQAIYAWNGADPSFLAQFADRVGGEVVRLRRNYRSTPQVVRTGEAVLVDGDGRRRDLVSMRAEGPAPTVTQCDDDRAEASHVARLVERSGRGRRWRDHAVLSRTNAQTALMAEALRARGVPYRVRGSGGLLDVPVAAAAVSDLGRATGAREWLADLEQRAEDEDDPEATAALGELSRLTRERLALDPTVAPGGLAAWLSSTLRGEGRPGDAVEVATFHSAKGLEWPVVHLTGLERGLVPISHAERAPTRAAKDEERRLLYVAVTRAIDELHVTWAARRSFGTNESTRQPSVWLEVIRRAAAGEPPLSRADELRAARSTLRGATTRRRGRPKVADSLTGDDRRLFDALAAWRTRVATAASVPAYVVFSDQTLADIATTRPTRTAALLRIGGVGPVKVDRYGADVLDIVDRVGRQ